MGKKGWNLKKNLELFKSVVFHAYSYKLYVSAFRNVTPNSRYTEWNITFWRLVAVKGDEIRDKEGGNEEGIRTWLIADAFAGRWLCVLQTPIWEIYKTIVLGVCIINSVSAIYLT
jgi:hypothetical protein